jgi:hypothetical protein
MRLTPRFRPSRHKVIIAILAVLLLLAVMPALASASPLEISNVSSGNITETTAVITWATDEPGNSTVNYGNSTTLDLTVSDSVFTTSHTINLSNLTPGTLYYYEVVSTNEAGNETKVDNNGGSYYTFTTEQTAPQIWDVAATNITNNSATIVWTTDQPSTSAVFYGETQALGYTALDGTPVYDHSVNLTGLSSNTLYYYAVKSTNAEGKTTTDTNGGAYYTFNTARSIELQGWGWFTNYSQVASATLEGYAEVVEREHAPLSYSMHLIGNLTLYLGNETIETIPYDMYGSRVRSLFYLRQEETGKSATFTGTWIDTDVGQPYIMTTGMIALPNPEGQAFKTARILSVILRTPEVEVPAKQADGFADNVEVMVAWITKFFDKLLDSLVGTGVGQILGDVLAKLMVLVAAVRDAVTPYIP